MVATKSTSINIEELIEAAKPFSICSRQWDTQGYPPPSIYSCLDRQIDIANPDHPTTDWWPFAGPCNGCILSKTLGKTGKGTLTPEEFRKQQIELQDKREYLRLKESMKVANLELFVSQRTPKFR